MKQTYTDIGNCLGCEACYRSIWTCPECTYTETVCDICGQLCDGGDAYEEDGQDICSECYAKYFDNDEEDEDDEQDV